MKAPLTKWLVPAVVPIVLLISAVSGSSIYSSGYSIQLTDDPNAPLPEASPGWVQPALLADANDPGPEFSLRLDKPALLETDPNEPMPECYPY
jgi:hypothetical protein